jgi:hypothetical protein
MDRPPCHRASEALVGFIGIDRPRGAGICIEEVYLCPQRRLDRNRSVERLSKKVQFELLTSVSISGALPPSGWHRLHPEDS